MAENAIVRQAPRLSTAELLRAAHDRLAEEFGLDNPMLMAAQHLVSCAAQVVHSLPEGNLESAKEALGCLRAATGITGYVVGKMGDEIRSGSR